MSIESSGSIKIKIKTRYKYDQLSDSFFGFVRVFLPAQSQGETLLCLLRSADEFMGERLRSKWRSSLEPYFEETFCYCLTNDSLDEDWECSLEQGYKSKVLSVNASTLAEARDSVKAEAEALLEFLKEAYRNNKHIS